ncbi:hypothetical protein JHW43_006940, partial [Diplocarpon mali]
ATPPVEPHADERTLTPAPAGDAVLVASHRIASGAAGLSPPPRTPLGGLFIISPGETAPAAGRLPLPEAPGDDGRDGRRRGGTRFSPPRLSPRPNCTPHRNASHPTPITRKKYKLERHPPPPHQQPHAPRPATTRDPRTGTSRRRLEPRSMDQMCRGTHVALTCYSRGRRRGRGRGQEAAQQDTPREERARVLPQPMRRPRAAANSHNNRPGDELHSGHHTPERERGREGESISDIRALTSAMNTARRFPQGIHPVPYCRASISQARILAGNACLRLCREPAREPPSVTRDES